MKWKVEVTRTYECVDRAFVLVEADTEEQAVEKAEESVDDIPEQDFKPAFSGADTEWTFSCVGKED